MSWRVLLRACRAARNAADLGPKMAAGAAAEELRGANTQTRIKVKAILASQAAKQSFWTDLRELDRLFWAYDEIALTVRCAISGLPVPNSGWSPISVDPGSADRPQLQGLMATA